MSTKIRPILVPPAYVLLIVAVALLVLVPCASAQSIQPPLVKASVDVIVPEARIAEAQKVVNDQFAALDLLPPSLPYIYDWAKSNGVSSLIFDVNTGHTVNVTVNGQTLLPVTISDAGITKIVNAMPGLASHINSVNVTSLHIGLSFPDIKPVMTEQTPVQKLIAFTGALYLNARDQLIPGGFTAEELGVYAPQLDGQLRATLQSFGIAEADINLDAGNITVSEKGVVLAEAKPNWDLAGAFVKPGILPEYQQLVGIGVKYLKGTTARLHFGLGESSKDLPNLQVEPLDVVIGADNSLTVAGFNLPNNVTDYVAHNLPAVPSLNVVFNGGSHQIQFGGSTATWEPGSVKASLETYTPGLMSGTIEKVASTIKLGVQIHRQGEILPPFEWVATTPTPEVVVDKIGLQVAPDGAMAVNGTTVPTGQLRGLGVDPATISSPLQMALAYRLEQVSVGVRTIGLKVGGASVTVYPNWPELLNVGMPLMGLSEETQQTVGTWTGRILPILATRQGIYEFNLTAMPLGTAEPEGLPAILNWLNIAGALFPQIPAPTTP